MLNQVVIVGRIVADIEKNEENGKVKSYLIVAVSRPYKNENGEYDTDFIKCILWNGIAENTAEYCHKGDVIGVKGRLQTVENETIVIAEKVTFLSSKKNDEVEDGRKEEN